MKTLSFSRYIWIAMLAIGATALQASMVNSSSAAFAQGGQSTQLSRS